MDFIPDEIKAKTCVEPETTWVQANDIKKWLKKRGIKSDVFFAKSSGQPDWLC
jgi:hypothetical protein